VDGKVHCAQALIAGQLEGSLVATERVTVLESAVIMGEITTPWIDVRPGAEWHGSVRVLRADEGKL